MANISLEELNQKYKDHRITFSTDKDKYSDIPKIWRNALSLERVEHEVLHQLWKDLYQVMPETLDEFFQAVHGICLVQRPTGEVSLGYILRYSSGNLTVAEGKLPATPTEELQILPKAIADFYRHTHNGFSMSLTVPTRFLPTQKWFTIDKAKFDISDEEEQQMGVELKKVILFYELNSLVYVGWDTGSTSHVLLEIKYREAAKDIDVFEEIEPYFFHADEYQVRT